MIFSIFGSSRNALISSILCRYSFSTERRKFTAPSYKSLTEPVEGLSKEGGGGGTEVEIKPQQNIHADEGGHKDGLGYLSFG